MPGRFAKHTAHMVRCEVESRAQVTTFGIGLQSKDCGQGSQENTRTPASFMGFGLPDQKKIKKDQKNYAAQDQKINKKGSKENKRLRNKFLESLLRAPAASLMRKA